jgi:hypothetical protein
VNVRRVAAVVVAALVVVGCSKRATPTSAGDEDRSPWSTAPIGSVYESRTVTRMEKPFAHETETTTKQTLVARNESEASIKLEISEGTATTAQVVKVPLRQPAAMPAHDGTIATKAADTCTVPAGTFDCTRATIEIRQGDATHSNVTWTAKRIPVPIKSVVTNENMTVTTELVSAR